MIEFRRTLPGVAITFILAGAFLVFFAAHAPGAPSIADTHGMVAPSVGVLAAVLWLAEVQPTWLYFGVVFGCAIALIHPSNFLMGGAGLAFLAAARALQVRFKL